MFTDEAIRYFFLIISVLWGAVSGSFSSMLSYRLPRDIPLIKKSGSRDFNRSFCPRCNAILHSRDLIPLLSRLMTKGKCRYCGSYVSQRYPIIEAMSVIIATVFFLAEGPGLALLPLMLSVPVFVTLTVIDWDFRILPDSLNISAFILGALYVFAAGENITYSFIASLCYFVMAVIVRYTVSAVLKKEALGWGDVKFFAVAGMWCGLNLLPQFLVISGVAGILFGIVYKKINKTEAFPFGPCLIISMIICFAAGELIFL